MKVAKTMGNIKKKKRKQTKHEIKKMGRQERKKKDEGLAKTTGKIVGKKNGIKKDNGGKNVRDIKITKTVFLLKKKKKDGKDM